MKIIVNNRLMEVDIELSVDKLLIQLGYKGWVAVFVNESQLLEREYNKTILNENDVIKIVKPLSGG